MPLKINQIEAKSIFIKSGLPASDWVINAYNGCVFGCMYCYAAGIARWKHPNEEWGSYLDVKINAPMLLQAELEKLSKKYLSKNFGSVFLSSVTDPYVGLERKFKLTRSCLSVLAEFGYEGLISIQTKSPLVLRDIDIIKQLKNAVVGFTVTTLDDKVSQYLEVNAPKSTERIKALKRLHEEGVSTYAFIGPLLPYFVTVGNKISELLDALQEAGVSEVWFEHINLSGFIKSRLYSYLQQEAPHLISHFENARNPCYIEEVNRMIYQALEGRNIKMGGKVIFHH